MRLWGLSVFLLPLVASPWNTQAADADDSRYDAREAFAISQAAIGDTVADYDFELATGGSLRLSELRGTPVIVSMIYTSCYHVCPMLTQRVADVAEVAWEALGSDAFRVVSVGFDTAFDTPERMRQYAELRGLDQERWHFLSATPETISALSRDLGFIFLTSPKGFDHLAQTTVLDASGRVYRQIYGERFETPELVEPLKELVFDSPQEATFVEGWLDKVRLFCTIYDPRQDRYRFDYSIFVTIFVGVLCLGGIAAFLVKAWREAI